MNNSTDFLNKTFEFEHSSPTFRSICVLIICGSITLLTILGNGLILISIKFRFHARSYSDYFIVSLCLADFFVGLFVMPLMTLMSLHLRWPFDYRLCYVWMSIDFTCSTASFLTLAAMALDRYYALTAPYFHLRNRSFRSVFICIISSWLIPFAIWPSSIFIMDIFNKGERDCVHPAPSWLIIVLCLFFYYVPLIFMLICYSRIIVNIKNIEMMIRETWGTVKFGSMDHDDQSSMISEKTADRFSLSSIRPLIWKYLPRHSVKSNASAPTPTATPMRCRTTTLTVPTTLAVPRPTHRHMTTTATFTGQRRTIVNEIVEDHLIDEELAMRTRFSSRTSSLPGARCISYYYYQNSHLSTTRTTAVLLDDRFGQTSERSRSASHSSSQGNGTLIGTPDHSDHSSSFDAPNDDEHRRLNRRNPPTSHLSTSYNSSRYSQRAVTQFMHERNKARLRRNQKASRMLGILLCVFLVCWLPFIIAYPTMVLFPHSFHSDFQSVIFWLGYFNSLLNPFLYVYSSRNFRQAIIETLCCYARFRSRQQMRYQWSFRH